jgi:hypothetical protein
MQSHSCRHSRLVTGPDCFLSRYRVAEDPEPSEREVEGAIALGVLSRHPQEWHCLAVIPDIRNSLLEC